MTDANYKEFVHRAVLNIQRSANTIQGLDPDIHEKLDEVVLSIYDQFDITFQRCSVCEEDVLLEEVIDCLGAPHRAVCKDCAAK